MLIPQYSIRWLLMLTAACATAFSVFGLAVRGSHWAQGVSIAVVSLVVVLLIHALVFTLVWAFSLVISQSGRRPSGFGRSPFAPSPVAPGPTAHAAAASDEQIPDIEPQVD